MKFEYKNLSFKKKFDTNKMKDVVKNYEQFLLENNYDKIKNKIINKMDDICNFLKYFDEDPLLEEINIIEAIIFLNFIDYKKVEKAIDYMEQKNIIFKAPIEIEFALKEKFPCFWDKSSLKLKSNNKFSKGLIIKEIQFFNMYSKFKNI